VAGLGPAIHEKTREQATGELSEMAAGWVYIITNRPDGTLYVGGTDNLACRLWEHREGVTDGFTKRYNLKRLVYCEHYDDIRDARQREQNMKHYRRAWKVRLILLNNPNWDDLYYRVI
jgi:putative endonuclease